MNTGKEESRVANYYNRNTARFIRFGSRIHSGTIHRKLYSPDSVDEPEYFSESVILEIIRDVGARRILDLGCGVGASIRYLKSRYQAEYTGITLSPVQQRIAEELGTDVDLGSYLDSQWYRGKAGFDLVYAIESLQHNPDHVLLLDNLRQVMEKGSSFIVIDDFLNDYEQLNPINQQQINRFKKYWHAHGFISTEKFIELAAARGFKLEEKTDFSDLMKKRILNYRLRDFGLSILSYLPPGKPAIDNIIGGGTLKLLQQKKLSGYYKLVFSII